MFKTLTLTSLSVLLDIFNDIWQSGDFPSSWREALVIPIPKPGKDASDPANYRPIALTSCLCKTLERMVNDLSGFWRKITSLLMYKVDFVINVALLIILSALRPLSEKPSLIDNM